MCILIADYHNLVREVLRIILESKTVMDVIAEIDNRIDVLGLSVGLDQDLVVVDFSIPKINDTKLTPRISDSIPDLVILVILFGD